MVRGVNKLTLIGNTAADVEFRMLPNTNQCVASVNIAINESYRDQQGQQQERVDFFRLTFWGRQAEIARDYVRKGTLLYVEGKLRNRNYEDKQGVKHYSTDIQVLEFQMLSSKQNSNNNMGYGAQGGYQQPMGNQGMSYPSGNQQFNNNQNYNRYNNSNVGFNNQQMNPNYGNNYNNANSMPNNNGFQNGGYNNSNMMNNGAAFNQMQNAQQQNFNYNPQPQQPNFTQNNDNAMSNASGFVPSPAKNTSQYVNGTMESSDLNNSSLFAGVKTATESAENNNSQVSSAPESKSNDMPHEPDMTQTPLASDKDDLPF